MRCPECGENLVPDGGETILVCPNRHHFVPGVLRYEDLRPYEPKPSHRCAIAPEPTPLWNKRSATAAGGTETALATRSEPPNGHVAGTGSPYELNEVNELSPPDGTGKGNAQAGRGGVPWPAPLADEALRGLPGRVVAAIGPYSEADPAALLAHFLIGAGALIGDCVFALAGDAKHPARLNAVVVGETSKGRKGSAARPIERLLAMADAEFVPQHITEGLSSGEGLIWAVRDKIQRHELVGRGADRRGELVEVDPGIGDKRLWVVESEFASALRAIQRDGNTLSTVVRRAWDSGDLRTLIKNSPAVATGAHICIMGHVTRDELLRYLDRSELASGFANRFLWVASKRSRSLPDGEGVPVETLVPLADELRQAREWALSPRRMVRDPEASELWHAVYGPLSEGKAGMFGAATSRAEAQVLRLSVLYAALDGAARIRVEHLRAGLAVWRYAEHSARWIFGDATGDQVADAILSALRSAEGGLTRTYMVSVLFGRNVPAPRIERALALLLQAGHARRDEVKDTGGRPAEVWRAG